MGPRLIKLWGSAGSGIKVHYTDESTTDPFEKFKFCYFCRSTWMASPRDRVLFRPLLHTRPATSTLKATTRVRRCSIHRRQGLYSTTLRTPKKTKQPQIDAPKVSRRQKFRKRKDRRE